MCGVNGLQSPECDRFSFKHNMAERTSFTPHILEGFHLVKCLFLKPTMRTTTVLSRTPTRVNLMKACFLASLFAYFCVD